jgi:glycosyltransferase involved in cell wall biosynthesis
VLLAEGLRHSNRQKFEFGYGYFLPERLAMVPALEEQGVQVICFNAANSIRILGAAWRVATFLKRWKADLVHCHLPIAGVVGRLAGRMCGIPVIYTEHNRMERYHPLTRRLNLMTWGWQNRVIAVSAEVASSIRAHAKHPRTVDIVLNGVDINRFAGEGIEGSGLRRNLGIPADVPVVGTVAVFRLQKALDDWLEAARQIHDRFPEVHFLVVGDGPLRMKLMNHSRSLGLADVVHFPGLQTDVRPHLAAMDVFMVSSIFEGLPVALLEAMAMRCAVVATAVGGIPEVIQHGENGSLVEPRNPRALADSVMELLFSQTQARRFGEKGRHTIEDGFSLQRMTREIEAIYLEVLGDSGNGR